MARLTEPGHAAQPAGAGGPAARRGPGRPWARRVLATVGTMALASLSVSCGTEVVESTQSPDGQASPYVNETRSDDAPAVGGSIVYGVPAETSSFNPALATWASYSLTIARSIYDTLAAYDGNGEVQPYLAERFEHSDDYLSWTVTLRGGVTYTNGKPLTAESFVRAQRALKASPVLADVYRVVDTWEVSGPLTFVVRTNHPWTSFPHAMASQVGVAVDPDWLTSDDVTHPVGTGPFIVDRWDVNREMVLRKNPNYWRDDTRGVAYPYLDRLTFRVVTDEASRAEALNNGELDLMMQTYASPAVAEIFTAARAGTVQAFSDKRFETPEDYVLVNTQRAPLNDLDARRALAHAIDTSDYVATVTGGLDEPADSQWKPGSPWHTPVDYPRYDLAEARRLVEAVKARNGGQFTVTLLANPSNDSLRIQQYVQAQWAKAGVDVKLDSVPQQTKIIRMLQADYDVVVTQQFDNVHPVSDNIFWNHWSLPFDALSLDFARISDPAATALTIEALGSTGATEKEKYAAVSRRLAELVPFIFLAHASRTVVAKPRVVNVVRADLPDGKPMLEFVQGSHPIHQISLRR